MNILQQVRAPTHPPPPEVAAGVMGFNGVLRPYRGSAFPAFPAIRNPTECVFCAAGRAFGIYVRHLGKSCALLDLGGAKRTPESQAIIAGLDNAPNTRSALTGILAFADFSRFIRYESPRSEFARSGYIVFLFLLRLQFEAPPMCAVTQATYFSPYPINEGVCTWANPLSLVGGA